MAYNVLHNNTIKLTLYPTLLSGYAAIHRDR